jgi:hypothetical protein
LTDLRQPSHVATLRDRQVHEVAPKPMLEAVAAADLRLAAKRSAALEDVYGGEAEQSGPPRGGRR